MEYLIGLDIGTSSVKGVLTDTRGQVKATARETFSWKRVGERGLELDPEAYLKACTDALKKLSGVAEGKILGICASSASGNLLLLDHNGEPLTGIIGWQDGRVTEEPTRVLKELDRDALYQATGWGFDGHSFPLAQLCYIKEHTPWLLENCGKVCMSTEYLNWRLTGQWGISHSTATPFYLADQRTGAYITPLLEQLGIPEEKLPPLMARGTKLGGIQKEMAESVGLPEGTPVILGTFDHPSAARGAGVLEEGQLLLSCGTSWVAFLPVRSREHAISTGLLVDPFLAPDGCWAVMSSLSSLSERIRLYIHRYLDSSETAFQTLSELASRSDPGAGGLKINPLDDPQDQRIESCSREHIARAIMEGTAALVKAKLQTLAEQGIRANSAVMVGGPSEDPLWRQILSQVCGIPIKVVHAAHAGAVGAAILAGIGAGLWRTEREALESRN